RDIDTAHTRRQLRVLGFAKMRGSTNCCPLYVAVACGEALRLDCVLADAGLAGAGHIIRIHVPEILLGAVSNAASQAFPTIAPAPVGRNGFPPQERTRGSLR